MTQLITNLIKRNFVLLISTYVTLFTLYSALFLLDIERGDNSLNLVPSASEFNPIMNYLALFWVICIMFEVIAILSYSMSNKRHMLIKAGRIIIASSVLPYIAIKILLPDVHIYFIDGGAFIVVVIQVALLVVDELRVRMEGIL